MVKVFPEPVCPYAKTVPLSPSSAPSVGLAATRSNTSSWPASGRNTPSNWNPNVSRWLLTYPAVASRGTSNRTVCSVCVAEVPRTRLCSSRHAATEKRRTNERVPNARATGTYAGRGQRGRGRVVPPSGRVLKARNRSGGDSSAVSRVYVGVSLLRCAARGLAGGRSRRCRRRAGRMTTGRTVSSVTSGDAFGVGFRRR